MKFKFSYMFRNLVLVVMVITIILIGYVFFFTEIGDRFARYHNYINIVVKIDGVQYNMVDTKIDYSSENKRLDTRLFSDYKSNNQINTAKFNLGMYGRNLFEVIIPKGYLDDFEEDIKISFGQFNTSGWHVAKYDIDVEIKQIDKERADISLSQSISYRTDGGKRIAFENTKTKEVSLTDNHISIYYSP